MTTATPNPTGKKVFLNKKFFFYVKKSSKNKIIKPAKLIKAFGGQIEQFLEQEVSYVLTDIPRNEWPPHGEDGVLERAIKLNVKLMSIDDLINWCAKYLSSQSSSDDDDEFTKVTVRELKAPFLKFEDLNYQQAPSVREFISWPEVNIQNLNQLPLGKSFFSRVLDLCVSATQKQIRRDLRPIYCEICSQQVAETIEDHIQSQAHKLATIRLNWSEVDSVIDSLPSLSTLNMRRLTTLTSPPNGTEHQEFLCLHKVESVSQLFNEVV